MKIINIFKNLINRVDEIDRKSKKLSEEKCYSSNPFAFQKDKTYVWVERVKKPKTCDD